MRLLDSILRLLTPIAWFTRTAHGAVAHAPGVLATVATPEPASPGAVAHVSPQENALSRIEDVWKRQAATAKSGSPESVAARVLACQFRGCLQSEPDLINWGVSTDWVQENYPLFCRALHAVPVPFKDFASELKGVMPKKRHARWKAGKRTGTTRRYYQVRDPTTNVVDLDAAERRRA
jgi:hypothetical protein